MEDISNAVEEIEDGVKERQDELTTALDKANAFDSTLAVRFSSLSPDTVKCIDFIKLELRFTCTVKPGYRYGTGKMNDQV